MQPASEIPVETDYLASLYRGWADQMVANPEMSLGELRGLFEQWHLAAREPEKVTYRSDELAGVDAIWAYPAMGDGSKVLLYFHGGGFVVGSIATHRKLLGHLANHLGVAAVAIEYRRAPEFRFPSQIEDGTKAYRELLARGFQAADITIAGDSAGGNMAIATTLKLRDEGVELPGAVILLSPWLDMQVIGETLATNEATDVLVNKAILTSMTDLYLNDETEKTHPLANPLKATYQRFPRMFISVSRGEVLFDNATALADLARSSGVDVTLSALADMQHVFHFLAGRDGTVDEELGRIGAWSKNRQRAS